MLLQPAVELKYIVALRSPNCLSLINMVGFGGFAIIGIESWAFEGACIETRFAHITSSLSGRMDTGA